MNGAGRNRLGTDVHVGVDDDRDREILAAIGAEEPYMLELLRDLVAQPTVLGEEAPGQAVMRAAFAELGLEPVDVAMPTDELRRYPDASPFSWDVSEKANVVAAWEPARPAGGRSLILNGHVDVVSAEPLSLWHGRPFALRRAGDWLYGRGAGDMKAGLAAMVGAVRGLARLGLAPRGRVELQSVVEEECTGNGTLACLLAGRTADAAVLTEPTGGRIWHSQVGVLWFQLHVLGRSGHAGAAGAGANAIEATFPLITALRRLEAEANALPPPPYDGHDRPIKLNIGVIHGGDWPSTAAGECTTHVRLALYPGEPVAALRERIEGAVRTVAASDPLLRDYSVDLRYDGFACEGYTLDRQAPLVEALATAAQRRTGARPPLLASTATSDARTFHLSRGIPAVCFGPQAENLHSVDERVNLPSMVETAQVIGLFIGDWCGLVSHG